MAATSGAPAWSCVLTLDDKRQRTAGSEEDLAAAIRRGADLRIYTEFRYDEHVDPASGNEEVVEEKAEFGLTYLLDDSWSAGVMNLRAPILPPTGFGPRPSISYFIYNQDGRQAIARPHLDGEPPPAAHPIDPAALSPKQNISARLDIDTNAPSENFAYEFGTFRYFVKDDWREALSHTQDGEVTGGSFSALTEAFHDGADVKVAIRGLCEDLRQDGDPTIDHEVFVNGHSGYFQTQTQLFTLGTHPLLRVRPKIPLDYQSRSWDFGWVMVRTDGFVARWLVDPFTLNFSKTESRHALRWFVR